ncbi:type II toxin-antitoxin system RelE/ParE family toxin [Rheinheimera riviphila]|uniref:Type II toxin-antitoxin system RelE/ParE family toxin n=1 Tax=Rheinheimera riviphila TaxID=1834037 RepID=A0A437QS13_9GAMM|nr:type II toxin-antitoxin system RelE/ParE family toxin [Rheinheimera riviphila]RVU37303.1 type II toxin-antitoxin system RelE/ParE family toxin [Rheinheimera riviphila]
MVWTIEWDERAVKELKKLDKQIQRDILHYLKSRIATDESPRRFGKALLGDKVGLWRYRVKDYRIICLIEDGNLVVLVLKTSHRKEVYD